MNLNFCIATCFPYEQKWLTAIWITRRSKNSAIVGKNNFYSLRNLVRQLYSLNQVTDILLHANEHFDLVIYSRADIRFEKRIEIPAIQPGKLYTPWFGKNGGLNDRFAMGDFATMIKYGKRYSMMWQYCQETGRLAR